MGDNGATCGNCGALNEAGAQFCMSCGVLLAAYQSPSGARPSAVDPQLQLPEPAQHEAAAPPMHSVPVPPPEPPTEEPPNPAIATKPEPGEVAPAEDDTAHSVEEIFGTLPDVDEHATTDEPAPAETPPLDPRPPVPVAEHQETATEGAVEAPQPPTPANVTGSASRQDTTTGPDEVESQPVGRQTRSAPPSMPPLPTSRWSTADQGGHGVFGESGQRASTTPPQTLIVIGGALILAACVLVPIAAAVDLPLLFEGPMWFAFPIGVIILVIGVIQLVSRRPNRF